MKRNTLSYWILPVLVILLTACTTTKTEKIDETSKSDQNSPEDLDRANKQYAKEVAVYRSSAETELRENRLSIAKLQDQKTELKEEALLVRNERIAAIQKSNDELELRMRQYRGDNRDNWKEFQREFDSDLNVLEKSIRDLREDTIR